METRRRFGDKELVGARSVGEKDSILGKRDELDDQGKWEKGHGAGPGLGGRRGLVSRQRIGGWVSVETEQ
jgi:hypothetical protein